MMIWGLLVVMRVVCCVGLICMFVCWLFVREGLWFIMISDLVVSMLDSGLVVCCCGGYVWLDAFLATGLCVLVVVLVFWWCFGGQVLVDVVFCIL